MGFNATGSGSYNLSGSGYLVAPTEYVGYFGSGAFTQTGGTNSVTSVLSIGSSGVFLLNGGLLQITSLTVGSNGTFSPNAGTLQVLGSFTYTGGAFGSRIINDGSVVLDTSFLPGGGLQNDTSLNVPAGFVVGSPTGGTANTVDNEGTINLAGGTLAGGSERRRRRPDRQ